MKFNIDKKTGALLLIIFVLLGALLVMMNGRSDDDMPGMHGNMHSSISNPNYTGADIMFLQMMIPHHQQAVDISNLAIKVSRNQELIALAKKIATDQAAEIVKMKNWLKDAGVSEDPGHSMSGMGGMLSETELNNLNNASGSEFDKLWLTGMINHHDGAIHMSNMILDAQNLEIKAFGEAIVKTQTAQIDQMKAMLAKLK